jgi:hypothetical protein
MKTRAVGVRTEQVTEYLFVEQDSKEWDSMWNELSKLPCNEELEPLEDAACYGDNEDGYGEAWQYMCSFYAPKQSLKDVWVWVHEFRHRCHPLLDCRVTVHLQASNAFAKAMKKQEVVK